MTDDGRLPPHDLAAEEAVVGSALIDGTSMKGVLGLVPADFYGEATRYAFAGCCGLRDQDVTINQITLAQELDSKGQLEAVGGVAFLSHLISITPTSVDMAYYGDIVKRLSTARKLIAVGKQIGELGSNGSNPHEAITKADELLLAIRKDSIGSPIVTPEDRVKMMDTRYEKLMRSPRTVAVKTELLALDRALGGGFFAGELCILGARPGMGKTTLLSTIANNVGRFSPVLFCTAEMSVADVGDRDVAGLTGLSMAVVRGGSYSEEDYLRIMNSVHLELGTLQVYYFKDHPLTTAKIYDAAMMMQMRYGLSLVVVDYLGLLNDDDGVRENQNVRLGNMSRRLKTMAQVLECPVLVAHQLNRAVEYRGIEDRRPRLHDLRESGRLEEDADIVIFMYRSDYYDEQQKGPTELLIPKMRQGDSGKRGARVQFHPTERRYINVEAEA